jgi:hypothetical protein
MAARRNFELELEHLVPPSPEIASSNSITRPPQVALRDVSSPLQAEVVILKIIVAVCGPRYFLMGLNLVVGSGKDSVLYVQASLFGSRNSLTFCLAGILRGSRILPSHLLRLFLSASPGLYSLRHEN